MSVAAPNGDLGFVPLQSWSWGPPQDPKRGLCSSHFLFLPPPGLRALLDWEESGLGINSPVVLASGRDFKQLLSWHLKPSPPKSSCDHQVPYALWTMQYFVCHNPTFAG